MRTALMVFMFAALLATGLLLIAGLGAYGGNGPGGGIIYLGYAAQMFVTAIALAFAAELLRFLSEILDELRRANAARELSR